MNRISLSIVAPAVVALVVGLGFWYGTHTEAKPPGAADTAGSPPANTRVIVYLNGPDTGNAVIEDNGRKTYVNGKLTRLEGTFIRETDGMFVVRLGNEGDYREEFWIPRGNVHHMVFSLPPTRS